MVIFFQLYNKNDIASTDFGFKFLKYRSLFHFLQVSTLYDSLMDQLKILLAEV